MLDRTKSIVNIHTKGLAVPELQIGEGLDIPALAGYLNKLSDDGYGHDVISRVDDRLRRKTSVLVMQDRVVTRTDGSSALTTGNAERVMRMALLAGAKCATYSAASSQEAVERHFAGILYGRPERTVADHKANIRRFLKTLSVSCAPYGVAHVGTTHTGGTVPTGITGAFPYSLESSGAKDGSSSASVVISCPSYNTGGNKAVTFAHFRVHIPKSEMIGIDSLTPLASDLNYHGMAVVGESIVSLVEQNLYGNMFLDAQYTKTRLVSSEDLISLNSGVGVAASSVRINDGAQIPLVSKFETDYGAAYLLTGHAVGGLEFANSYYAWGPVVIDTENDEVSITPSVVHVDWMEAYLSSALSGSGDETGQMEAKLPEGCKTVWWKRTYTVPSDPGTRTLAYALARKAKSENKLNSSEFAPADPSSGTKAMTYLQASRRASGKQSNMWHLFVDKNFSQEESFELTDEGWIDSSGRIVADLDDVIGAWSIGGEIADSRTEKTPPLTDVLREISGDETARGGDVNLSAEEIDFSESRFALTAQMDIHSLRESTQVGLAMVQYARDRTALNQLMIDSAVYGKIALETHKVKDRKKDADASEWPPSTGGIWE